MGHCQPSPASSLRGTEGRKKEKNPLTAQLFLKAFLFGLKYFKFLDTSDLKFPGYSFIKEDYTSKCSPFMQNLILCGYTKIFL